DQRTGSIVAKRAGLAYDAANFIRPIQSVPQCAVVYSGDWQNVVQSVPGSMQLLVQNPQQIHRHTWTQAIAWICARPITKSDFAPHRLRHDASRETLYGPCAACLIRQRFEDVVGIIVKGLGQRQERLRAVDDQRPLLARGAGAGCLAGTGRLAGIARLAGIGRLVAISRLAVTGWRRVEADPLWLQRSRAGDRATRISELPRAHRCKGSRRYRAGQRAPQAVTVLVALPIEC